VCGCRDIKYLNNIQIINNKYLLVSHIRALSTELPENIRMGLEPMTSRSKGKKLLLKTKYYTGRLRCSPAAPAHYTAPRCAAAHTCYWNRLQFFSCGFAVWFHIVYMQDFFKCIL